MRICRTTAWRLPEPPHAAFWLICVNTPITPVRPDGSASPPWFNGLRRRPPNGGGLADAHGPASLPRGTRERGAKRMDGAARAERPSGAILRRLAPAHQRDGRGGASLTHPRPLSRPGCGRWVPNCRTLPISRRGSIRVDDRQPASASRPIDGSCGADARRFGGFGREASKFPSTCSCVARVAAPSSTSAGDHIQVRAGSLRMAQAGKRRSVTAA